MITAALLLKNENQILFNVLYWFLLIQQNINNIEISDNTSMKTK